MSIICLFVIMGCSDNSKESELPAKDVIEFVRTAYADCSTYSDVGEVAVSIKDPSGVGTYNISASFQTNFTGKGRYYFRYDEQSQILPDDIRYEIISIDNEVRSQWSLSGEEKQEKSISIAVGGATAITHKAAYTITSLLFHDSFSSSDLFGLNSEFDVKQVSKGTKEYFVLTRNERNNELEISIDKESFLVNEIKETMSSELVEYKTITTYTPVLGLPVDESIFVLSQLPETSMNK